jgi:CelD/BcsL family acetyltransferase involved in cellulose biosynthesis
MTGKLHCRLVESFAELGSIAEDWDRLASRHHRPQIFYGWAWHAASWDAYGDQRRLCTALVYCEESLVGILPVAEDGEALRFFATPQADYCDLLCAGAPPEDVLSLALVTLDRAGFRQAHFQYLQPDSTMLDAVDRLPRSWRRRLRRTAGDACPTLIVEDPGVYDALTAKKSLRRHERALSGLGEVSLERLTVRADVQAALEEFYRQHRTRRILAGDRSLFLNERHRRFYDSIVARLETEDTLHFSVLSVGDRRAAFHLGFLLNDRFVWYKPTIDVDLWDQGPGEVLLKRLFELGKASGWVEFDFARGDEHFKRRFSNHDRPNCQLLLCKPGLGGRLQGLRLTIGNWARSRVYLRAAGKRCQEFWAWFAGARRRHGLTKLLLKGCRMALRRTIYARDEVVIYHRNRVPTAVATQVPDLRLQEGSLSALAEVAIDHPDFFDVRRLRNARMQLKGGDRLILARRGEQLVHVAWLGTRQEIVAASEVGREARFELPSVGTVIYDCWTPPGLRGQGIYQSVLQRVAEEAQGEDLWIYCHVRNHASRRGIIAAGFSAVHRLGRTRWLGLWSRGHETPERSAPGSFAQDHI